LTETTPSRGASPGRGTVQILISRVLLLLSGFAVSIILARGLGPAEFGVYGVVMSMMVWLERVISAGIPGATATLLLRGGGQQTTIQQSARVLMGLLAVPMFGLVWIAAPTMSEYLGIASGTTLIRLAALNLPAMALYYAYDSIFNGQRMFAAQSMLQIAQSAAKLAGILILLWIGLSVAGAFIAHIAATAIAVLLVPLRFRIERGRPSWATMREMIRIALPMGTYLIALSVLMSLSLWQLQAAAAQATEDVGFYVASVNLTRIMMMVPSTVSGVLFASLAWAISTSQQQLVQKYLEEAVRFALVVTAPACVVLAIDAPAILGFLFGANYSAGGQILAVLCIAFALVAIVDVLCHALMANGRFALAAGVLVALVPLLYGLNAILIPRYGAVGAALASLSALSVGAATVAILASRHLGVPIRFRTLSRIAAACVVIGFASAWMPVTGWMLVIKLGGLAALYFALLWLTGVVSTQDLRPFAVWKSASR
jgi:O-antigen/teichoic acid export membrane protein